MFISDVVKLVLPRPDRIHSSLINILIFPRARSDVSFIMLVHENDCGLVVTRKKRRQKQSVDTHRPSPNLILNDLTPAEIRNELGLSGIKKLLLAFAFVTDGELRLAQMHPETLACDVVCQTNKEQRDMFVAVGKRGDNTSFHALRSLIPSAQQWVFQWIFEKCMPELLGFDICSRNELLLTDGDRQEYLALQQSVDVSSMLPLFFPSILSRCISLRLFQFSISFCPGPQ